MDTVLSRWDGSGWQKQVIDSGRESSRIDELPPVATDGESLLFAGRAPVAGAYLPFDSATFTPRAGKVSPLIVRYFLRQPPVLSVHAGQANLFVREPHVVPGRVHEIQRSVDLQSWQTLDRRYASETGGIDFTDPDAPEGSAFYRAVPVE
jgi:hypothetical protein